jgi:hypothetical protein
MNCTTTTTETQPLDLHKLGYRCLIADGSLIVQKPKPDRTRYMVCAYKKTCTCYAGRRGKLCRHIKGLLPLVFDSMETLSRLGKYGDVEALVEYWFNYACSVRKGFSEGIPQYLDRLATEAEALAERQVAA